MTKGNRVYRDRLFRFIFKDKKKLLSLYNALNHSHYSNEEELEINTLEDFIYIGMKNDVSFILDSDMCLYEHQSTFNPNMPLRGLFYFSELYQKYLAENAYNLYGSSLIQIPVPKFVVFYNGDDKIPERSTLKLSDAFLGRKEQKGSLEVEALMLDINAGKNRALMESCRDLREYAFFVEKVKEYKKQFLDLSTAIKEAIDDCIEKDIMKDILIKQKAEVTELIFKEFDEAEFLRQYQKTVNQLKEELRQSKEEIKRSREEAKRSQKQAEEEVKQFKSIEERMGLEKKVWKAKALGMSNEEIAEQEGISVHSVEKILAD